MSRDGVAVIGPTPIANDEGGLLRRLSSCAQVAGVPAAGDAAGLGYGWDLVGKRTPVTWPERRRTPAELLTASDELTRLMLLQVTCERAPAMLRWFRLLDKPAETPNTPTGRRPTA